WSPRSVTRRWWLCRIRAVGCLLPSSPPCGRRLRFHAHSTRKTCRAPVLKAWLNLIHEGWVPVAGAVTVTVLLSRIFSAPVSNCVLYVPLPSCAKFHLA